MNGRAASIYRVNALGAKALSKRLCDQEFQFTSGFGVFSGSWADVVVIVLVSASASAIARTIRLMALFQLIDGMVDSLVCCMRSTK
jgi:hypothetical protein